MQCIWCRLGFQSILNDASFSAVTAARGGAARRSVLNPSKRTFTSIARLSETRPLRAKANDSSASKSEEPPRRRKPRSKPSEEVEGDVEANAPATRKEQWQIQKAALKEKFGKEAWNPRKKLSPDTLDGIRTMHASDPDRYTTPVLAQHFEVSPEAIRRILKSKWQPSAEVQQDRRERWERRGERVWTHLSEMGVKPPKPWRVAGVGRQSTGEMPSWKAFKAQKQAFEARAKASRTDGTSVRRDIVATRGPSGPAAAPDVARGRARGVSGRML